jgi:AcrR family transcriptional regulator
MTPAPVRPPRQKRSRETLERLLAAAEELLSHRTFEELSVQDVVRRAGSSVGAFYARFEGKDGLLPALYDRYDATMPVTREDLERLPGFAPTTDLAERARQIVRFSVRTFRRRRGLLRALALHARLHPEAIPASARERRHRLHAATRALLLELADQIEHPDPETAVDVGLYLVAATSRERVLFDDAPHASAVAIADATLERELTRALLAYLRGPST